MKRSILAGALALLALPHAASAQPKPDLNPAVWVVKDNDTTLYLFGTFHLLDGKSDWFNDEVKTAFDSSQEVELEAIVPEDPTAVAPLVTKYAIDMSGRKLSDHLSADLKAKLDKELTASGMPAGMFEMFEPWFAAMTLTQLRAEKLGLRGAYGPEAIITSAAKAAGKPVGEIESLEKQLVMLDTLPEDQQVLFLDQTIESIDKMDDEFPAMIKAWGAGDTKALAEMLNEGLDKSPMLYKVLLVDRNAAWADWVSDRLSRPGTVFVAVGAGHLAGKDSLIELLAKRGIKAERFKG